MDKTLKTVATIGVTALAAGGIGFFVGRKTAMAATQATSTTGGSTTGTMAQPDYRQMGGGADQVQTQPGGRLYIRALPGWRWRRFFPGRPQVEVASWSAVAMKLVNVNCWKWQSLTYTQKRLLVKQIPSDWIPAGWTIDSVIGTLNAHCLEVGVYPQRQPQSQPAF